MATRIVETEADRRMLIRFLESHALPITVKVETGGKRTVRQNKLSRLWIMEIAEQKPESTSEEWRGYCKLTLGVPILRAEDDEFREKYDKIVRPLPYETKLALMQEPLDFPVTRLMNVKQQTAYLDAIHRHFSSEGVVLTDPGDLLHEGRQAA